MMWGNTCSPYLMYITMSLLLCPCLGTRRMTQNRTTKRKVIQDERKPAIIISKGRVCMRLNISCWYVFRYVCKVLMFTVGFVVLVLNRLSQTSDNDSYTIKKHYTTHASQAPFKLNHQITEAELSMVNRQMTIQKSPGIMPSLKAAIFTSPSQFK